MTTGTTATAVGPAREDGRLLRSRRTRERVLAAFLSLVESGDIAPTVDRIAERAEVSARTVFHQFADLETLYRLAGRQVLRRVAEAARPVDPGLPLADRVAAFAAQRARVLELLHPVACSARLREPVSQALRDNRDTLRALSRTELGEVFGAELAGLPTARRERVLTALGLLCDWAAWWQLREESGLSAARAQEVVREALLDLLTGLPGR